jgi:flagellar basal body P-ring protein FlgI
VTLEFIVVIKVTFLNLVSRVYLKDINEVYIMFIDRVVGYGLAVGLFVSGAAPQHGVLQVDQPQL